MKAKEYYTQYEFDGELNVFESAEDYAKSIIEIISDEDVDAKFDYLTGSAKWFKSELLKKIK